MTLKQQVMIGEDEEEEEEEEEKENEEEQEEEDDDDDPEPLQVKRLPPILRGARQTRDAPQVPVDSRTRRH